MIHTLSDRIGGEPLTPTDVEGEVLDTTRSDWKLTVFDGFNGLASANAPLEPEECEDF